MSIDTKKQYKKAKFARFFCNFFETLGYHLVMKTKLPTGVSVQHSLRYGDSALSNMDVYLPPRAEGTKSPLFIYMHGGGFVSGKMKNRTAYCYNFVKDGYVCANLDYDLAPEKFFPHQIIQLVKALDYLYGVRDKLAFDPTRVVIGGESAGAYLAIYMAMLTRNDYLKNRLNINSATLAKLQVKSLVLISGAMEVFDMCENKFFNINLYIECFTQKSIAELKACKDEDFKKTISPVLLIGSDFPPSVIIKSKGDLLRTESDNLAKRLTECGVDHVLILADGLISSHAFAIATKLKKGKICLGKTLEFVSKYVKNTENV